MKKYLLLSLIPLILVVNLSLRGQGIIGTIYQPGLSPTGISIYENGNKVFVADTSDKIFMYDGATFELLDTIYTTIKGIDQMVMMEGVGKLYATVFALYDSSIAVIDANTGGLNQLLSTGSWASYIQLRKDEELGRVYALCAKFLYQIDAETDDMTIIPGIAHGYYIEINPVTHEIFYKKGVATPLIVIDAFSYDLFEVPGIICCCNIGINWEENKVYIPYTGGGPSLIYNRNTGIVSETTTSNDAMSAVFNPTGNRMYSSSEVDRKITIIDGITDSSFNMPLEWHYYPYVCYATNHVFYSPVWTTDKVCLIDDYSLASMTIDAVGKIIGINQLTNEVFIAGDDSIKIFQDQLWSLASPALVSPADGIADVPLDTILRWTSVPGAISYHAQVSRLEGFLPCDIDKTNITDTMISIHLILKNTVYYWRISSNDELGTSWSETRHFTTINPTDINDVGSKIQYRIFPNPLSSQIIINITLKESSDVRLEVLNDMGQVVAIIEKSFSQGEQQLVWNTNGLPTGLYFYRLTVNSEQQTANGKLMVVR